MLMFIQGLYSPKNVTIIGDFGFAALGLEGTLYALKIVGTLLTFLSTFYLMTTTTYTGKLVAALTASGMNPKVGYLILARLNVVPQMQRRMSVIQEAQNARGVEPSGRTRAITITGRRSCGLPPLPIMILWEFDKMLDRMNFRNKDNTIGGIMALTHYISQASAVYSPPRKRKQKMSQDEDIGQLDRVLSLR